MKDHVRVRFAPSPTGHLHIGSLRSALFNLLFARHYNGVFLLRIEDTDFERSKQEYVASILSSFSWLAITPDEPIIVQSERIVIYQDIADKLVQEKKAYRCYCTAEEVAVRVGKANTSGESYIHYDGKCRDLTIPEGKNKPFVIRFKLPQAESFSFDDVIRGTISFSADQFDDFIIIRSDRMPMYNFAVVVDDAAMNISHVIRGEEHLINTPKQILLAQSCGYSVPLFAHIPLILGPSGEKLSKRDGAVSVVEYKKMGFLADALMSYLARLGWAHGDKEIFTRDELCTYFTLEGIGKKGAMFDIDKLKWVNSYFIKQLSADTIITLLLQDMEINIQEETNQWSKEQLKQAVFLFQERATTLLDLVEQIRWLYHGPNEQQLQLVIPEISLANSKSLLDLVAVSLEKTPIIEKEQITTALKTITKQESVPFSQLAKLIRAALFGVFEGPSLAETIVILGKDETIKRIHSLQEYMRK